MSVNFEKAQAIFLEAVERSDPGEQSKYLDVACGDDQELRQHLEILLNAHGQSGSFLEKGALAVGPTIDQPVAEKPGTQIGPYKLLQQVGEGGMGVVYMAEQKEPVKRRVALKIIKPGMDTRQVIARFEAERQALAMMDHPNIAKVLDAGATDSGRPYFVMELVNGISITQYCDEQHLTPKERLELFVPICQAIQHAHQKGIIHRDLKPSNILVAEYDHRAVPKVIDFGVAKATSQTLTEKTMFTQLGQIVGTLEYMSPEQAKRNQLDVDTRSDIYSLGVLLYELLTGETPFDRQRLRSAAFDEMLRIIREEEPSRPSTKISGSQSLPAIAANRRIEPARLQSTIRGELDWIVMKALEKDRARRYETASKFAEDVQNYLNDEPVLACPPSAGYRLRKFGRRYRGALVTGGVALLVLIALTIVASTAAIQFQELAEEKAILASERGELAENLQAALHTAQNNLDRATSQQRRAEDNLDLALEALDSVYLKGIGKEKLLGEPRSRRHSGEANSTPLTELEKELLKRGLEFYDQFARQNDSSPRAAQQTAQAYYRVGLVQAGLGNHASAELAHREAIKRLTQLTMQDADNAEYHQQLAESLRALSWSATDWSDAKSAMKAAVTALSRAIELKSNDPGLYRSRATIWQTLGNNDKPLADLERALELDPNDVETLIQISRLYQWGLSEEHRSFEQSLNYAKLAVELAPESPDSHLRLAQVFAWLDHIPILSNRSVGTVIVRDETKAREHFSRALGLAKDRARVYLARANFLERIDDNDAALADLDNLLEIDPSNPNVHIAKAEILKSIGRFDDSLSSLFQAEQRSRLHNPTIFMMRGLILVQQEKWKEALQAFEKAKEVNPKSSFACKEAAPCAFHVGRYNEVLINVRRALELEPTDTSALWWTPPALIAKCPNEALRRGILELADSAVERSSDPPRARRDRIHVYVSFGRIEKAQDDLAVLLAQKDTNHVDHYTRALLAIRLNENPAYRDSCRTMLKLFANTDDPVAANLTAWTCVLIPDVVDDYATALMLAEKAHKAQPQNYDFQRTLGAVLYRAGRLEEAQQHFNVVAKRMKESNVSVGFSKSHAYTRYFLAMTNHRLGHKDEATTLLKETREWMDKALSDRQLWLGWNHQLTVELLRDEATALIHSSQASESSANSDDRQQTHLRARPARNAMDEFVE